MRRRRSPNGGRAAVIAAILLLSSPLPARAQHHGGRSGAVVECSSQKGNYQYCPTYDIGSVRLTRQLSKSPCRPYDTWGASGDGSGVWVRDGCRGVFVVERGGRRPPGPRGPTSVTCKSDDFSYRACPAPMWGRRVFIQKQLSRTRCVRGDNWGEMYSGIWVDRGCGAVFAID